MGNKKKKVVDTREPVKLRGDVVQKVRDSKKKTRVPISEFFEEAALKELRHLEISNAEKVRV